MRKLTTALALTSIISISYASSITIPMRLTSKSGSSGAKIGYVVAKDTQYGLLLTPHLKGLKPGLHGFHVHVNPSCADNGLAAGGHLDPYDTGKHLGPYNPNGHLGDLPALYINKKGVASLPVLAPRLTTKDIHGHSLMIHVDGDNYSDLPQKLGGGGARIACGVIT